MPMIETAASANFITGAVDAGRYVAANGNGKYCPKEAAL